MKKGPIQYSPITVVSVIDITLLMPRLPDGCAMLTKFILAVFYEYVHDTEYRRYRVKQ